MTNSKPTAIAMTSPLHNQGTSPGTPNPDSTPRNFSCLTYRTRNIGDIIQTIALSRLLPPMAAVFRHQLESAPTDRLFVVNGFLERDRPPLHGATCLFAGISGPYMRKPLYLDWLRRSPWPVGARDPVTASRLSLAGIPNHLSGCATLTLPRYNGPRQGIVSVDFNGPGTRLHHHIPRTLSLQEQWALADLLLTKYRTAEAVYTSRLHVALPCLAFGTPVFIASPEVRGFPERFSLIKEMGIPFDQLVSRDISAHANHYIQFLESHLGQPIIPSDPKPPALVSPDHLRLRDRTRFAAEDLWYTLQFNWGREGRRLRRLRSRSRSSMATLPDSQNPPP